MVILRKLVLFWVLMCSVHVHAVSQQLMLDPSFDGDGISEWNTGFYGSGVSAVAQQSDGKLIYAASGIPQGASNNTYIAVRMLLDGTIDSTFGNNGYVTGRFDTASTSISVGRKILVQPDGKIILGGYTGDNYTGVIRLNSDGSMDTTFNGTGNFLLNLTPDYELLTDMALQPDGKIVIAGYSTSGNGYSGAFLARLLPDATPDTTFNGNGFLYDPNYLTSLDQTNSIALQPDGKILTLGGTLFNNQNRNIIHRYNPDGSFDVGFGIAGTLISPIGINDDVPGVIALQPNGKIIVASYTTVPIPGNPNFSESDDAIARYNSDGTIDSTFNSDGILIQPVGHYADVPNAIRLDSFGNIYIAGYANNAPPCMFCVDYDMTLFKLDPDGNIDSSFAYNGIININWGIQDNICFDFLIQQDGKFLLAGASSQPSVYNQMAAVRLMPMTTGIDEQQTSPSVTAYPNPFNEQLTIRSNGNATLTISDITGKLIYTAPAHENIQLNTSKWSRGIYFYRLVTGNDKVVSGRVVKM